MGSKLTNCKTCGKEVAKNVKKCPHCGANLKMGLMAKLLIGIVGIGILVAVTQPSKEEQKKIDQQNEEKKQAKLAKLANAPVSDLSPKGELAEIFQMNSKHTDIQRENKEKEIIGKIVKWNLKVYEVGKNGENYKIQTSGGMGDVASTFVYITPRNQDERKYIESLKTDDPITIKGKIDGVTFTRDIDIDPAIIIR